MTYNLYHTMQFSQKGYPIFKNSKNELILAKSLDDYYFLLSHHNNEEAIDNWISSNPKKKIDYNPNTLSEQASIAYQHFILPTSFQYMMHKHLFGYAHIIQDDNVLVFRNSPDIFDCLYKIFGKKYPTTDLFNEENYNKFQNELLNAYNNSLIFPTVEFSQTASSIIINAITLARSQSFKFLDKNTKITFN